jgi:hypothetical protein
MPEVRIPTWSYPDEEKDWNKKHYGDHINESSQIILDLREAIDEAKRYMLMVRE